MKKIARCLLACLAVTLVSLAGCGDTGETKQPKLSGTPDPKLKPASVGAPGGGAPEKGSNTPKAGVQ
jgi:hypothetical protein